jgi:hypothetical protein
MPSAGLELAIPAIKPLQTYALDRTATGIDFKWKYKPRYGFDVRIFTSLILFN